MKLLVSWMNELERYVSREFYFIMHDLIHVHGWRQMQPGTLSNHAASPGDLFKELLGCIPEVVLFWETYDLIRLVEPALRNLGVRSAVFADDLHMLWGQESRRAIKLEAFANCDLVLSSYAYNFDEFFPELHGCKKAVWIPHSASPDFCLPFNPAPEDAILLSGFIGSLYPLRMQMKMLQQTGGYPIKLLAHPGYGETFDYRRDARVGAGYARSIHDCKAAFTDALTFQYVVAKYFEIPATGALLVADGSVRGPLEQLGLVANEHYLPVDAGNLEEVIDSVFKREQNRDFDAVRRRGQELVLRAHKTSDRAARIDHVVACR